MQDRQRGADAPPRRLREELRLRALVALTSLALSAGLTLALHTALGLAG